MRFAITADHCEFFNKNHFIELEEVLSSDQVAALKKNAEETLAKRLRSLPSKLAEKSSKDLFQAGYDLWRDNQAIQKITQKQSLASLASQLFQTLPLRYAFDQCVRVTPNSPFPFAQPFTMQQTSCISPLAGGLILLLDELPSPIPLFPFPQKVGSALFISPDLSIPWPLIFATPDLRFMMIGFAKSRASFRPDTQDPHAINLKKLGYVFNDLLKDSLHPILLRKAH